MFYNIFAYLLCAPGTRSHGDMGTVFICWKCPSVSWRQLSRYRDNHTGQLMLETRAAAFGIFNHQILIGTCQNIWCCLDLLLWTNSIWIIYPEIRFVSTQQLFPSAASRQGLGADLMRTQHSVLGATCQDTANTLSFIIGLVLHIMSPLNGALTGI